MRERLEQFIKNRLCLGDKALFPVTERYNILPSARHFEDVEQLMEQGPRLGHKLTSACQPGSYSAHRHALCRTPGAPRRSAEHAIKRWQSLTVSVDKRRTRAGPAVPSRVTGVVPVTAQEASATTSPTCWVTLKMMTSQPISLSRSSCLFSCWHGHTYTHTQNKSLCS